MRHMHGRNGKTNPFSKDIGIQLAFHYPFPLYRCFHSRYPTRLFSCNPRLKERFSDKEVSVLSRKLAKCRIDMADSIYSPGLAVCHFHNAGRYLQQIQTIINPGFLYSVFHISLPSAIPGIILSALLLHVAEQKNFHSRKGIIYPLLITDNFLISFIIDWDRISTPCSLNGDT